MRLRELLCAIDRKTVVYESDLVDMDCLEIGGLSFDSNSVQKGDLFFCLTGGQKDGHNYAEAAVKKGATAVVTERVMKLKVPQIIVEDTRLALSLMSSYFYGNPSKRLKIIGVTGTNGKTTVTYMLSSILKAAGKSVGIIGTLGIYYAKKQISPELTTPDPIYLYEILSDMQKSGVEYVLMEVSAHALHYEKDAALNYECCIFTNLSQDHLDFFESMEEYKRAKTRLFFDERAPLAIINGDDEVGREIIKKRQDLHLKTLSYGLDEPSDAFAVLTDERLSGSEFMLNILDKLGRVNLSLTGKHNVYNALAAATAASALGADMSAIVLGLRGLKSVKGRLERVAKWKGADVFIDFAHTPDGLEKSLSALKKHCKGRMICLFGCGGNRDAQKRPLMGECVAKIADYAVITTDNPRYEDPMDIIQEIEKGFRRFSTRYVVVPDRESAIYEGLSILKRGDVLLVAGKGGETYQEIMGIKYSFNDNAVIKKAIARLSDDTV